MAFTNITGRKSSRSASPGRMIMFRLLRDYHRVDFLISRPLAEAITLLPGDRFMIEMGHGEDFGTFRLIKVGAHDRRGNRIRSSLSRHFVNFTVTLKKQVDGLDRRDYAGRFPSRAECTFEIDEDGEVITVKVPVEPMAADAQTSSKLKVMK